MRPASKVLKQTLRKGCGFTFPTAECYVAVLAAERPAEPAVAPLPDARPRGRDLAAVGATPAAVSAPRACREALVSRMVWRRMCSDL